MQVVWLSTASRDLYEIRRYIAKYNPAAAMRTVRRIKTVVDGLSVNPNLGRAGRIFGIKELVIMQTPYIAAFRIERNKIQILKIIHHARNWEEAMNEANY